MWSIRFAELGVKVLVKVNRITADYMKERISKLEDTNLEIIQVEKERELRF